MTETNYKERVGNRLSYFYIVSMSTIFIVSLSIYVLSSINVSRSKGIAEVINIAGSQRMLCQRIVLYLSMYDQYGSTAYLKTAQSAMTQIYDQHASLINPPGPLGLKEVSTDDLVRLYEERGLDARIKRFLAVSRRAINTQDPEERTRLIKGMSIETQHRLLAELDEAVNHYTLISNKRISEANLTVHIFIVLIVATVLLNFLYVYRPVQKEISSLIEMHRGYS